MQMFGLLSLQLIQVGVLFLETFAQNTFPNVEFCFRSNYLRKHQKVTHDCRHLTLSITVFVPTLCMERMQVPHLSCFCLSSVVAQPVSMCLCTTCMQ